MRRIVLCRISTAASVLLGVAYGVCLLTNMSPFTGFLRTGGVLPWYAAFAVCAALAIGAGMSTAKNALPQMQTVKLAPLWGLSAVAGAAQGVVVLLRTLAGADLPDAEHSTPAMNLMIQGGGMLCAILFFVWMLFSVIMAVRLRAGLPMTGWLLALGTAGSAALYIYMLLHFLVRPASWNRLLLGVDALAALCCLLNSAALLRACFLPDSPKAARNAVRMGLLCFAFGTCLDFPQSIWRLTVAGDGIEVLVSGVLFGALGLLGLAGALCAARAEKVVSARLEEKKEETQVRATE